MRVYIPSMGRAANIGRIGTTHDFLMDHGSVYVVPPDEVDAYKRALNNAGGHHTVIGCKEQGIAAVRHWIGKEARRRGENKFCMMDDDLMFAVRQTTDDWHLRKCNDDDVRGMLEWIDRSLNGYAHASVSPRMVNVGEFKDGCNALNGIKENSRTLRVLAYQTDAFPKMKHGRVPVMEDFDVNLQLLEAGLKNVQSFYWSNDQRGTGEKGGCSSYRTLEEHNKAAVKLHELHPGFVKLREKENKTGAAELRKRLEVTIQWGKAWESSQ